MLKLRPGKNLPRGPHPGKAITGGFHEVYQCSKPATTKDCVCGGVPSSGRAELIEEHHGRKGIIQDIRVVGDFSTKLEVNCARCLDPVLRDLHRTFDLLYRPRGTDAGVKEIAIGEAETDIGYYEGEGLLLEDVLREQVLLAAPMKAICREGCKGLCPHCGRNLNLESCVCSESVVDPRWTALKEIKEKLES